jgi:hypothetical protein
MTIKTEAPKYSQELLDATEKQLKAHDLRLKVGIGLEDVLATLEANGVTPEASFGHLQTNMRGQPAHSSQVFEGLAKQRTELFFPRDPSGVTSRDQLDQVGKMKLIREKGLAAFESLPATSPKETTVVLDKNRLTKAQYLSLDRTTRASLAGSWGAEAIGKVMARRG